jgi:hypothetical protein
VWNTSPNASTLRVTPAALGARGLNARAAELIRYPTTSATLVPTNATLGRKLRERSLR